MTAHGIAIYAETDWEAKAFRIIERDAAPEPYDLFEQLILYRTVSDFADGIAGRPLHQIWTQGNSRCVICKPTDEAAAALFYDSRLNAAEHYLHALKL